MLCRLGLHSVRIIIVGYDAITCKEMLSKSVEIRIKAATLTDNKLVVNPRLHTPFYYSLLVAS